MINSQPVGGGAQLRSWLLLSSREAGIRSEEPVAALEVDAEAAAHSGVADGGDKGLADTDGSRDHGVVAGHDERQ